jgi:hypothetical protein
VKEKIVGYVGRTTKTKSEIKELNDEYKRAGLKKKAYRYINSKTNFGNLVYGLEEITDETVEVVVVEGIFDKCNVDRKLELGLGGDRSVVCVCTFKCHVSPQQYLQIKNRGRNIEEWSIFYDPDVLKEIIDTGLYLQTKGEQVHVIQNTFLETDPGDMTQEEMLECITNKVTYEKFFQRNLIRKELN